MVHEIRSPIAGDLLFPARRDWKRRNENSGTRETERKEKRLHGRVNMAEKISRDAKHDRTSVAQNLSKDYDNPYLDTLHKSPT